MGNKKILLGLTTTRNSDWRGKIRECEELGITEVALFPTCLGPSERQELYRLLEKSPIKSIPHVHLREDMNLDELEYLVGKFKTRVFNIHSDNSDHPALFKYGKFVPMVFVENTDDPPSSEELQNYGGICVDFSHLETARLSQFEKYEDFWKTFRTAKIGCCHVSPFSEKQESSDDLVENIHHWYHDLEEFDYLSKYLAYLPDLISLEVANPFKEQVAIKRYLERIIQ